MNTKIKVVWLCHFTNSTVQEKIKANKKINEYAPWIPPYIELIKELKDIELYVISPHEYISGVKTFISEEVNYYFYNAHMPLIGRHWPGFFKWDYISNFNSNKRITKRIVNGIKPDLIHLHGAENAYFCSSILQFFDKYPIIFTLQGLISSTSEKSFFQVKKRIEIEKIILTKISHAFYSTETMKSQLISFNPKMHFYWNDYPLELIEKIEISKKFDIVFFARITRDKGIGDLIKALAIVKKHIRNISLCVIGGGQPDYFKKMAEDENVSENIYWAGFLPTQKEVHLMASEARISVLPTYHDMIPGTIIESMFLGLPVVAYDVGSIHEINKDSTVVTLVKKADIEGLAMSILNLLSSEDLRDDMAKKGMTRANEMYTNNSGKIKNELHDAYFKVIDDFQQNR